MTRLLPQTDGLARLLAAARRHPPDAGEGCAPLALLLDGEGQVIRARTVQTAAPGLGACALRVALARARAVGSGSPTLVLLYWSDQAGTPCGPCRQGFLELTRSIPLHLAGGAHAPHAITREALMPEPFLEFQPESSP